MPEHLSVRPFHNGRLGAVRRAGFDWHEFSRKLTHPNYHGKVVRTFGYLVDDFAVRLKFMAGSSRSEVLPQNVVPSWLEAIWCMWIVRFCK